jgi:hypothetical protein
MIGKYSPVLPSLLVELLAARSAARFVWSTICQWTRETVNGIAALAVFLLCRFSRQLFPTILSDFSRQRLRPLRRNNIATTCGVGTVRCYKADGSFRGKDCYTAEVHPAHIDRWHERIRCRRSFYVEAPR